MRTLTQLIAQWRQDADGPTAGKWDEGAAYTLRWCADRLHEALLPLPAEEPASKVTVTHKRLAVIYRLLGVVDHEAALDRLAALLASPVEEPGATEGDQIADLIIEEMRISTTYVQFDGEQWGVIRQALSDAALEALNRRRLASPVVVEPAPQQRTDANDAFQWLKASDGQ